MCIQHFCFPVYLPKESAQPCIATYLKIDYKMLNLLKNCDCLTIFLFEKKNSHHCMLTYCLKISKMCNQVKYCDFPSVNLKKNYMVNY